MPSRINNFCWGHSEDHMNSSWTLLMTLPSETEFMGPLFSLWQCLKTVRFVGKTLPSTQVLQRVYYFYLGHRKDQRSHGPLKMRKDRRKTTTKHHCVLLLQKATTETCCAGLSLGEARSSTPREEIDGTTWTLLRLAAVCPEAARFTGGGHTHMEFTSPHTNVASLHVHRTFEMHRLPLQEIRLYCITKIQSQYVSRVRITTLALRQVPYSVHNFLILKKFTGILDSSVLILWLKTMRYELHGFCILMMLMQTVIILDADWCTCI